MHLPFSGHRAIARALAELVAALRGQVAHLEADLERERRTNATLREQIRLWELFSNGALSRWQTAEREAGQLANLVMTSELSGES